MKVQEAIKTIETLGGYKFIGRRWAWNYDLHKEVVHYDFDGLACNCLGQLRFYAKQFAYTHKA